MCHMPNDFCGHKNAPQKQHQSHAELRLSFLLRDRLFGESHNRLGTKTISPLHTVVLTGRSVEGR